MKALIPIIFALFALSCEPEKIIKYVDKPVYLTQTLTKTDTVETVTEKEVLRIDSVTVTETDTVYITDTITNLVTDTIVTTKEVIKYDTIVEFIFVTDTVYVERKSELTYPEFFEPWVDNFFEIAKKQLYHVNPLVIGIHFRMITGGTPEERINEFDCVTYVDTSGALIIMVREDGCYEGMIYRELAHWLYGIPYQGVWNIYTESPNYIMAQNWPGCLEDMSEKERESFIRTVTF